MEDHKIQQLRLQNFTCFEKVEMTFSSGINVFIGENGTGKTHLLKILYGLISQKAPEFGMIDVGAYFVSRNKELIRKGTAQAKIDIIANKIGSSYKLINGNRESYIGRDYYYKNTLFIPVIEMLTWYKGFPSLYEQFDLGLDKTLRDLAIALDGYPLKGNALLEVEHFVAQLENAINAKVLKRNDRFYFQFKKDKEAIAATMVANGINKLGQLIRLVQNGRLSKNTILFWDEPEAGLNPRYINVLASFIQALAKEGVQVFVATHDYLLIHQLSFTKEYQNGQASNLKFFSLFKGDEGATEIESAETLNQIENNPILDEYAALHDLELQLYKESLK